MASKTSSSLALFLALNLFFFTLSNACGSCPCGSCPGPNPRPTPRPNPRPNPRPSPRPRPTPQPTPGTGASCPRDALKLGICANVLSGLLNLTIGKPPVEPCCALIQGLADLEAAVCLCTAIKANILGINLNIPISLSLLLNVCGNRFPKGFQCA